MTTFLLIRTRTRNLQIKSQTPSQFWICKKINIEQLILHSKCLIVKNAN